MTVTVEAGKTVVCPLSVTVEAGIVLKTVVAAVTVEAGNTTVEPG